MNRITNKLLEKRVELLNNMLDRPTEPYQQIDGKLKANIGNIYLDHAYGGVGLYEMANDGGGVKNITYGHMTKRELDNFITGMLSALRLTGL